MQPVNSASALLSSVILMMIIPSWTSSSFERRYEYGCTEVPTESIIFYWNIKSAKYLIEMGGNEILSPAIYSRNNTDEWKVHFQPNSKDNNNYVAIYLRLIDTNALGILVKVNISFVSPTGQTQNSRSFIYKYTTLTTYGYSLFITRSSLVQSMRDDNLIIRCHVVLVSNETTIPCGSDNPKQWPSSIQNGRHTDNFQHLMSNQYGSDVTILAKDGKFFAHKSVLTARSSVFANILQPNDDKASYVLAMEHLEPMEVQGLLEFLYTDDVSNIDELAYSLLPVADHYELLRLKNLCEKAIYETLDENRAADILLLAHVYHSDSLKKQTLDFIANHIDGVMKSQGYDIIMQMYPSLLKDM